VHFFVLFDFLASLVRVFMFLGFSVLPPAHSLIPASASAEMMYLACEVDDAGVGEDAGVGDE